MKIKKLLAIVMAITTVLASSITVFAGEPDQPQVNGNIISEVAEKYDVTEDEIINLNANLKNALEAANEASNSMARSSSTTVPVSENLVLTITTEEVPAKSRAVYDRTITSTAELKNIFGVTVVTLKSFGVFRTNGTTSIPIDAYGTHNAAVWNITNHTSKLGSSAYNSWVRNSFSGEFNIGIDFINMTIQTFNYTCKIYCNAAGKYSATWDC